MCKFSKKLIAWMDRELPSDEDSAVERHLEACSECRNQIDAYRRVSSAFDRYLDTYIDGCLDAHRDTVNASDVPRGASGRVPVVLVVGAMAAALTLILALHRRPLETPALKPQFALVDSANVDAKALPLPVTPIHSVHRQRAITKVQVQNASAAIVDSPVNSSLPVDPMIRIAIPTDEMFPPGAVPDGIRFVGDVSIAADGSAERLSLRPRLTGFERRTTQP